MNKDETRQNYLEAIYIISLKNHDVRAIDIAEYLNFSRPTVSIALKQLASEDYITITNNKIKLTEKGRVEAYRMYERHNMIAKIFMELGVDEKTAYHDSCMIEHDLSDVTFEAIKKAYHKYLELRKDS